MTSCVNSLGVSEIEMDVRVSHFMSLKTEHKNIKYKCELRVVVQNKTYLVYLLYVLDTFQWFGQLLMNTTAYV